MKSFECTCGQPLFFPNTQCLKCGAELGYDPQLCSLGPLQPSGNDTWTRTDDSRQPPTAFRLCAHRLTAATCNWLVPADSPHSLCLSCRLTRTIPNLDLPQNVRRIRDIESAKRRVLVNLLNLRLPVVPQDEEPQAGLAFDFLEPVPDGPPIVTGHSQGLITLNVAEADDDYREKHRESLNEPYRTLIGHFRHELAHYYWDHLIRPTSWLSAFRSVFGDEQADYETALKNHYTYGPPENWQAGYISAYAASHPWEDWAESWTHYLHIRSTLDTVVDFGLHTARIPLRIHPFTAEVLFQPEPTADGEAFLHSLNAWVRLTTVLNEVSRSMGQPDLYPFVLNAACVTKLHFVHCVIHHPPPQPLS